jgi:transcriptional regulator with XRE-family HTH domain
MTITPSQCRAARALIGWSQGELATVSGVSKATIANFELDKRIPYDRTLDDVVAALQSAGAEFTNGKQPGVRTRPSALAIAGNAFAAGREVFETAVLSDRYPELSLERFGPNFARLIWRGRIVGTAAQLNGSAYFDPLVRYDGIRTADIDRIFTDWAEAALDRVKSAE